MSTLSFVALALLAGIPVWLFVSLAWPTTVVGQIVQQEPGRGVLLNIEGVRGFLAFSVFLSHTVLTAFALQDGVWGNIRSRPVSLLGAGGVSVFFVITAFLFWSKALRAEGRLQIRPFLKGRVLRLAPLYLAIAATVIVLSLVSNPDLTQYRNHAAISVARWLTLGILGTPDIGNVHSERYIAGVFWSLRYEWLYYLTLPFTMMTLCWPVGRRLAPWILLLLFPIGLLRPSLNTSWILLFVSGMLCAHLWQSERFRAWTPRSLLPSVLLVGGLVSLLLFDSVYGSVQAMIFGIIFLCILKMPGNSLIGRALASFVARALGSVSYSIYMVHGLILYAVSHILTPQALAAPISFFLFVLICGLLLVYLSMLTFLLLEYPFFRKGRRSIRMTLGFRRPLS